MMLLPHAFVQTREAKRPALWPVGARKRQCWLEHHTWKWSLYIESYPAQDFCHWAIPTLAYLRSFPTQLFDEEPRPLQNWLALRI